MRLRIELQDAGAPVSVTLIKPWAIGTPLRENVKNYFEDEATLPPPVYDPEEVARAIVHAATHRRRDIFVGGAGVFTSTFNKPMPRVTDWLMKHLMWRSQFRDQPKWSHADNLHHAGEDGGVRGEWSDRTLRPSLYTRASLNLAVRYGAMAGAGAMALLLLRRGLRRR